MSIHAAVDAYRQSAYKRVELDIETALGKASLPIFGGLVPEIKRVGNSIVRPFSVTKAMVLGGNYPIDAQHVHETPIPEDIKDSPYGEGLLKIREYGRKSADQRSQSVDNFLHGRWTSGFRAQHAANYNDHQINRVVMPGETTGPISNASGTLATGLAIASQALSAHNSSLASLGNLTAPTFAMGNAVASSRSVGATG